jgi:fumarate reductase flavoprotein subunit
MNHVVIVGAGLAGLVAGVDLAERGAQVMVLEKRPEPRYPCNTRYSGGGFHLALRNMRSSPAALYEALRAEAQGFVDDRLLSALAEDAARTLDWLVLHGATFGIGGPAEFMSNMLEPFSLRETGLAGHWSGKGADLLLERLEQHLLAAGGTLHRDCRAISLRTNDCAVVGVTAQWGDGRVSSLTSDAVVLADGGFQGNVELLREHICRRPERLLQRGPATGNGDCFRMASEIGAKSVGLDSFYGHVQVREAMDSTKFWPYPLLDVLTSAGVLVDESGKRFTDEGLGGIACANAIARLDDPLAGVLVMDIAIWEGPGREFVLPPNPALVDPEVMLYSADTIAELARLLSLPEQTLAKTVNDYNGAIAAGTEYALHPARSNGKSALALNARPISRPPFLALRVCAGITYTTGGLAVDHNARVSADGGGVIAGLYAAGSVTGGFEGGPNAVYLGGLAKASILGLRVARAIAKDESLGACTRSRLGLR